MFLFWILILSILCIKNIFCQSHFLRNLEKSFRVLLCKNISPNYQLEYSLIPVPESSTIYPKRAFRWFPGSPIRHAYR